MAKRKSLTPEEELMKFVRSMEDFLRKGQYPSLTLLIEGILNFLMQKEREIFLENNPQEYANGNYQRTLATRFGELHPKIPPIRFSNSFRPALLPLSFPTQKMPSSSLKISLLKNLTI